MALSGGIGIGPGGISGGVTVGVGPLSASLGFGAGGVSLTGGVSGFSPGLFVPNNRNIGGIYAQVTIQEQEKDELVITEHPIEQGAPINDHAYKRPAEVTIKAGWSAAWAGDLSASGGIYSALLGLQASFQPFNLYTGKRVYRDMLIQNLSISTDQHSEFALMADISCRQVILVKTSTATVATSSDSDNHKDAEKTAPKDSAGSKQPRDVGTGTNIEQLGSTVPQSTGAPTAAETAGNIEQGNVSSEPDKVEAQAARSVSDDALNTKDMQVPERAVSDATKAVLADRPERLSLDSLQVDYQQLMRRREWQRMSRSRRSRGGRSSRM